MAWNQEKRSATQLLGFVKLYFVILTTEKTYLIWYFSDVGDICGVYHIQQDYLNYQSWHRISCDKAHTVTHIICKANLNTKGLAINGPTGKTRQVLPFLAFHA